MGLALVFNAYLIHSYDPGPAHVRAASMQAIRVLREARMPVRPTTSPLLQPNGTTTTITDLLVLLCSPKALPLQ